MNAYRRLSQTPALKPFFERAWRWKVAARKKWSTIFPDPETHAFMAHNRRKFPHRDNADAVVLVGQFNWNPSLYLYSLVANDLCDRRDARIETFDFSEQREELTERVYASFGARRGLDWSHAKKFEPKAETVARDIFSTLRTKWDVLNITVEDLCIGDLIYDTYLRFYTAATVELTDPRLREMIREAVLIVFASTEYFHTHKVVGVFPDHTVYIKSGILVRVAFAHKVPVYLLPYNPHFYILQLDPQLSEGMRNVTKRWSYYKYREVLDQLTPEQQAAGRAKARVALEDRLSGKIDPGVLVGRSAYQPSSAARILADTPKPKILILLHDFCDSVHSFRRMLFPDFYEWACFLFEEASKTDFEWYAKPHPNSLTSEGKNTLNKETIAQLSARNPKIRILDAGVSNRQLVDEGLCAAFTVHGTAGHEFAAMGVPVVNAGDNLHVAFNFNLTPPTVEEYLRCIANAGHLGHVIDRREVEEFYYMHYFYFHERNVSGVNPIEEAWRTASDFFERSRRPEALAYFLKTETSAKEKALQEYFETLFGKTSPMLGGGQWATIGTG